MDEGAIASLITVDDDGQRLLELAPDAILVLGENGLITSFNRAAERLFGWTAAEMRGRPIDVLRPLGSAGGAFAPAVGGAPWEMACVTKAGRPFLAEVRAVPLGEASGPTIMFRDLDAPRRIVDALINAEQRLARVTVNLPGIVFQRLRCADGSIHYPFFTDGVRDLLGYDPQALRVNGQGCLDVVHWADRDRHKAAIAASALTLQPCIEEFRAITSGDEVRWLSGTSRPRALPSGDIVWDGLLIDVTERRRAELRLEMIMDHAADSIVTTDTSGFIESANAAAADLFGYPAEHMLGMSFKTLLPRSHRRSYVRSIVKYLETGDERLIAGVRELLGLRADGTTFVLELAASDVRMEGRQTLVFIGRDITARKRTEERLRYLAYYDPVTGIANRSLFLDRLGDAWRLAQMHGHQLAVLSLGIDRFSIVNTTGGHLVGDRVLAAMAQRLQTALGTAGTVARDGGDRFLIVIPALRGETELNRLVDDIVGCCRRPLQVEGDEFDLTACIGISLYPRHGDDPETMVKHADTALSRAKEQGPGSIELFSEHIRISAVRTLSLQSRIRRALDNGDFVPHFQPQVDLVTGDIVGAEALARWTGPEYGMTPPAEFVLVAEECGLIDVLCEQILRIACQQAKAWQDAGLPAIPVAVNISGRQFRNSRRLIQTVESVLSDTGLAPRYLELELTESSAMRDAETAIAVVTSLRQRGIECAIDDFGTGYSSLGVLKRFPIHKLKIDRSFVSDLSLDGNDAAIVSAIIAMAHAMRLKVVAEGVELPEHLEFLRRAACDQIQGYLFSAPVAAHALQAMLAAGHKLTV